MDSQYHSRPGPACQPEHWGGLGAGRSSTARLAGSCVDRPSSGTARLPSPTGRWTEEGQQNSEWGSWRHAEKEEEAKGLWKRKQHFTANHGKERCGLLYMIMQKSTCNDPVNTNDESLVLLLLVHVHNLPLCEDQTLQWASSKDVHTPKTSVPAVGKRGHCRINYSKQLTISLLSLVCKIHTSRCS